MRFADIAGQREVIDKLVRMTGEGRVPHAILFTEEPGYGALPIALAFVQYISCNNKKEGDSCGVCPSCNKISKLIHPDLHFAVPVNTTKKITSDKKPVTDHFLDNWRSAVVSNPYISEEEWYEEIGMEEKSGLISVNESAVMLKKLSLMSYEGGGKFMLIWLPERMNRECANKLLKILEEPAEGTFFLLVTQSAGDLLSTIISRCQVIMLKPEDPMTLAKEIGARCNLQDEEAGYIASVSGGSFGNAIAISREKEADSQFPSMFCNLLDNCIAKNLSGVITSWEEIAQMGREKQKQFCGYALNYLRKCYMYSIGNESSAFILSREKESVIRYSKSVKPEFWEKAYVLINKAVEDLERNVNPKFVFADLSNRFFISL
jgi:DNA polymerase-3 subunit delta'